MPSGQDYESERFADAWEQQLRRPAGRGGLDPELAADLDLAAALSRAGQTVSGPDHETSARMRANVMDAITGGSGATSAPDRRRIVGDATTRRAGSARNRSAGVPNRPGDRRPTGAPDSGRRAQRSTGRRAAARSPRSRLMANALAGFCAVLLLGALTVVIGRGALPGDTLYGVKRASESVEMGLTNGPEARGRKNLEFASTRLDEISGMLNRSSATAAGTGPSAAGLDPSDAALVAENLRAFDEQARAGSRLLLPLMSQPSTGGSSAVLSDWARSQSTRLGSLGPSLPADQQAHAADSRRLMDRLGARATALEDKNPCASTSGGDDEFAPLPSGCGVSRDVAAPTSTSTTTTTGKKTTPKTTTEGSTTNDDPTKATSGTSASSSDPASSSRSSQRDILPPLLPRTSSPAPVNVPLPVPGLPPVTVPPIVPGLPGISLG